MRARMARCGMLLIGIVGLSACRQVEARLIGTKIEPVEPGEVMVTFKADQDLFIVAFPCGYLRIRGEAMVEPGAGQPPDWNCWAYIQELRDRSNSKPGLKEYVYRCWFPTRADREGQHDVVDSEGRRSSVFVRNPYDLLRSGEHALDFYVVGVGSSPFGNAVRSNVVVLNYSAP